MHYRQGLKLKSLQKSHIMGKCQGLIPLQILKYNLMSLKDWIIHNLVPNKTDMSQRGDNTVLQVILV